MMHPIFRVILCFVLISLAGCVNHQVARLRANDQISCNKSCEQRFKACGEVCHNNCNECAQSAHLDSVRNDNKYKHEQDIRGGVVALELKSFRDPLQCRKITCDCLADYTVCAESCKGLIHKRLQITPVCC